MVKALMELAGVALCYLLALCTAACAVALAVMIELEKAKEMRENEHP